MKQLGLGLNLSTKKTRKREFLEEMERVVPWGVLVQIVEPHYPRAKTGRPPFDIETMLRIHYLQQWFALSDPAMEEALHDMPGRDVRSAPARADPSVELADGFLALNCRTIGIRAGQLRPTAASRGRQLSGRLASATKQTVPERVTVTDGTERAHDGGRGEQGHGAP
jgi:IS5 family transposase